MNKQSRRSFIKTNGLIALLLTGIGYSLSLYGQHTQVDSLLRFSVIQTDTLFESNQNISILHIPVESVNLNYAIGIAQDDSVKMPTSKFGFDHDAIAALNGGFFQVQNGGSVTYLEMNDSLMARRSYEYTGKNESTNFNGALVITKSGKLVIEGAKSPESYLNSNQEKAVLITGPLLIHQNRKIPLNESSFVNSRHPRSCIGITKDEILFIVVDGRHNRAAGQSLPELQEFLSNLGCLEAINLDGGGSSTLWLNTKERLGVVNHPSDNRKFDHRGERKVANAIILTKLTN